MFGFLQRLFASFGRLADSVNALADTTDEVRQRMRSQLQLDQADAPRVLEHHDAPEADGAKPARNGRAKATA